MAMVRNRQEKDVAFRCILEINRTVDRLGIEGERERDAKKLHDVLLE